MLAYLSAVQTLNVRGSSNISGSVADTSRRPLNTLRHEIYTVFMSNTEFDPTHDLFGRVSDILIIECYMS